MVQGGIYIAFYADRQEYLSVNIRFIDFENLVPTSDLHRMETNRII